MDLTGQRIAKVLILTSMALLLLGCTGLNATLSPGSGVVTDTPTPGNIESSNPDYAIAQATIDAGQGQLSDLSRQSTAVGLNIAQAANAAAQATKDYNQRQKSDLDFQATAVSLNIAHAAATQQSIKQQTKAVGDATTAAQNRDAAATKSAYLINVTQTAQVQGILESQTVQAQAVLNGQAVQNVTQAAQAQANLYAQATQTAQAAAALTTYPLTATPFAVTQAAILMTEYSREQQSFVDRVVNPMIPVVATLLLLLFILVIVVAYRRFLPKPWPRRLLMGRANINPNSLMMIDGVAVDHEPQFTHDVPYELTPANPPRLPGENKPQVEIVAATEPPVVHWIAEVEHQLDDERGLSA
jgi:hypothetical protein